MPPDFDSPIEAVSTELMLELLKATGAVAGSLASQRVGKKVLGIYRLFGYLVRPDAAT